MIHGDDVVLGVLPLFHVYGLNAVLGGVLRHRAKLVLAERFDPQGTLDLIEDEACSVRAGRAAGVRPTGSPTPRPRASGSARCGWCCPGSAPLAAEVIDEFTDLTGLPVHQGYGLTEAAPVVTSTLCCQRAPERLGRGGAAGHRAAAGRRPRPRARGRGPGRDPGPRRQPLQRLLARRRRRARRRGLVVDRRRRLPRRERRPVPGRPAQGAGHRLRLQRLPDRGRGRRPRGRRRHRGRRHRRRRRRDRRGRGRLRRRARAPTRPPSRPPYARTARSGWPASSSPPASRSSTSCRSPSPARCRRAGCAASSAAARSACWSDREPPASPSTAGPAATSATTPGP